jgi:hypothetical protein
VTAESAAPGDEQSPGDEPSPKSDPWTLTVKWIALLAALCVLVFGLLLLPYTWHPEPIAAPFTRVGGQTNVETAVDASRFWLNSPQVVVETSATAPPSIMLEAARCAMIQNAPLLFISKDQKRQLTVQETIDGWNKPQQEMIQTSAEATDCLGKTTDHVKGLSTLPKDYPLDQFPALTLNIPPSKKLNSFVVFVAALGPGFLPDVAVGMALSAHMAAQSPASLIVVPRYLEADPGLESQLESQNEVVNGVVLGQTATIPGDTRALLRQLLTSSNRQDLFAQLQADMGSLGPVTAALLALIGVGVTARAGRKLIDEIREPTPRPPERIKEHTIFKRIRRLPPTVREIIMAIIHQTEGPNLTPEILWRTAIDKNKAALGENQKVTIWLRSGTKVVGIAKAWYPHDKKAAKDSAKAPVSAVLQLDDVMLTRPGDLAETVECDFLLVPVADIELIAKVSPDPAPNGS